MAEKTIVILEGDQTGQELLEESLRVLNRDGDCISDLVLQMFGAIYESVFEAVYEGVATSDLGGPASTTEFTDEVIRRVRTKLEVWKSLA